MGRTIAVWLLLWGIVLRGGVVAAEIAARVPQDPQKQGEPERPQDKDTSEGKRIVEVVVEPADQSEIVLRLLRTRTGGTLRMSEVHEDEEALWQRLKVTARVDVEEVDDGVRVFFVLLDSQSFDHYEIHGLYAFSEREIRTLLGLDVGQRMLRRAADQYAATLAERYRRKGYAFVQVRIEEDREHSVLRFWVDEGPEVKVRNVRFIGNESFPGWAALGLTDNLINSAHLESQPAGAVLPGDAYSAEVLDEDLDRLRVWYRQRGFRDALVELVGLDYSSGRSRVDITIRVIEGRRYRVASVEIQQVAPQGKEPLYPKNELMARIKTRAGQTFDWLQIDQDKLALARYYGERGHPREGQYGRAIQDAFRVDDPVERFDFDKAEVHLTFVVHEGTPKSLRAVQVRGNTDTQDRVILRKVFQMPGDRLDMGKLERSQGVLDALKYFNDSRGYGGVRFELMPVQDQPDVVDLAVDVQEGDTGQLLWGGGVSSAFGLQARIQFIKRNFDIGRPPSSWNPIDWFSEIGSNKAFHGAGQELNVLLAPGTEVSYFDVSFFEPDIFRTHMDTIGLRVGGYRRLQAYDSFRADSAGVELGLSRAFTEDISAAITFREESVRIGHVSANAPAIVFGDEGRSEIRGLSGALSFQDIDYPIEPTTGYRLRLSAETAGGFLGADQDFWKLGLVHTQYFRLWRDSRERAHVLRLKSSFDWGEAFGDTPDLFVTERFYMGGNTLRGFDQRRAGPFQFGKPVGGEARVLSSLEYGFPIFSTRQAGQLRETEVLRGHLFADFGLLGLDIHDLGAPRLTVGIGINLLVPVLNAPLEFDLAWPILDQDQDEMRQFYFSISRN
ncbi:MAG: BamA/TamA family outer membrane protein [Planctomycetota bacterium]